MELTEKFIDAVGLENFTIGGTSLGGTVSLLYTLDHPDRIKPADIADSISQNQPSLGISVDDFDSLARM